MLFRNVLFAALAFAAILSSAANVVPPQPSREFRAGWVPSVGNSQWPSRRDLPVEEQKAELLAILNRAAQMKLNTIVLQVRPACDALYASKLEPWSEFLTGQMGLVPQPYYDPLEFAVAEAHKRGLELHAWINPYRARIVGSKSTTSANHVTKKYPGMIIPYGKYLWLDPGQQAVQDYSLAVVMDIVRRYDIDGLHMDDYFYPYAEKDESKKINLPFKDDASWNRYVASGGKMGRSDWRRENVNGFIKRTYQSIKAQKPWVKFGVSPFGIWKPGFPATTSMKSGNMFEEIYCDSRKWWTNGWVDYLAPQLYWPIQPADQSYTALLKWWAEQNVKQRHLWPGMNTGKTAEKWKAEEIVNQIKATRAQSGATGHIHWSMKSLMRNSGGVSDAIQPLYEKPALIPAMPWLKNSPLGKPTISLKRKENRIQVEWQAFSREQPSRWVLQYRAGNNWVTDILPGDQNSSILSTSGATTPNTISITAVNRYGTLSAPALVELK